MCWSHYILQNVLINVIGMHSYVEKNMYIRTGEKSTDVSKIELTYAKVHCSVSVDALQRKKAE